jgi:hypothetical protein
MDQPNAVLDHFLAPLGECLTPELAQKLVAFKADEATQAHIDELAQKCNEGSLTEKERAEYEGYVETADIIAIVQAKAREVLASAEP